MPTRRRGPPPVPRGRSSPPVPELEHLVHRCLAGDDHAWGELLARFERLIYAVIRRLGFVDTEGADIYQRVTLTLYEKLGTVRNIDHLGTWIVTTTRRECFGALKQRDRERRFRAQAGEALITDVPDRTESSVERVIEMARATDELQRLPPGCRDLLTLLFLGEEQPAYAEVAARLGIRIGSIGPSRARCLAELRRRLGRRALWRAFEPGKVLRPRSGEPTENRGRT